MQKFFSVSSQHSTAKAVIDGCLQQLDNAPHDANFGFIYATDAMSSDYRELLEQCKQKTGIQHWVGTLGLGVISSQQEYYDTPAASLMLAQFDDTDFTMVPLIGQQADMESNLNWPRQFATNFGIIHGDPSNVETQTLIQNIQQHIENGFIVGGLTSSRDKQFQVVDQIQAGGISGVLFSENVGVLTNLSQGCSPVGAQHTITKAQENVAVTLDGKSALDILMQDMGASTQEELEEHAAEIFAGLCVKGSDSSDYTVRNLVGVDLEHKVFAINDYLIEGNELIFCRRDNQTAVDDMQQMLDKLAKRLKQTPKGGLYVSCLGRGREQFGDDSEEVKMIHDTLGDFPLTGFFANGEIHHDKLYGYTGVLTLFI